MLRNSLAGLLAAVLTVIGGVSVPRALASEYNAVVDLGGAHAAGVLVVVYCSPSDFADETASFCMNNWADALGEVHFGFSPGTYYVCAAESGEYRAQCDRTDPDAHRITVTDPEAQATARLVLVPKLTNPVNSVEAFPVTWSRRKGTDRGWNYSWMGAYGYSFAESAKKPWIAARLVNQDGVVLMAAGRESVTGYGSWSTPMGGGVGLECGFMIAASGRQVVVTSTRLEITASVPNGSRSYGHTARSQANKCSKPRTLVPTSVQWAKTPRAGAVARADVSTWPSGVTLTYRWLLNGKRIKKATSASYRVPTGARGKHLVVEVTGRGAKFTTATQSASQYLAARSLGKVSRPKVRGAARVGRTLRAVHAKVKKASVSYQWYANGKKIPGATKRALKLRAPQAGATVRVRITWKRAGYASAVAKSRATTRVARR
ncbi:hypothetical protein [Rarobacter incanus]|nr:hypothetical protein [Rarobacter incanus]